MGKSIVEIFEEGLIDIVSIGILTVLTGGKGFTDMASFGCKKLEWLKTFLELPNGVPSHNVFGDVSLYLKEDVISKDKKELEKNNQYFKTIEKSHGRIETRE